MKKNLMSEKDLRFLVRNLISRKINENSYLFEEEEVKASDDEKAAIGAAAKIASSAGQTTMKGEEIINDIDALKTTLKKSGGTDNLAKAGTGYTSRGTEVAVAGIVGGGVAAMLGGTAAGTLIATAPISGPVLAAAAIGTALYYILDEPSIGSEAVQHALDTTLYKRVYEGFESLYTTFINSDDPKIRELSDYVDPEKCLEGSVFENTEELRPLVEDIHEATQGGTFLGTFTGSSGIGGIGTDEELVRDTLKKCKSFLGVSQLSKEYWEVHKKDWTNQANLYQALKSDISVDETFRKYVHDPIESLPFIMINKKEYTVKGFKRWIEKTRTVVNKLIKERIEKSEEVEPDPGIGEEVSGNYVREIQKLINQYCADKDLDYNPIKPDGLWGPRTDGLWNDPYLPHVLSNHSVFKTLNVEIGNGRWSGISAQLIKTHPGYTSGEIGCYRFCKDALADNDLLGKKEGDPNDKPIKYYKGSGGKRKEIDDAPAPVIPDTDSGQSRTRIDGRLDYRNIKIRVEAPGGNMTTLAAAGLGDDQEFAKKFLGGFNAKRLNMKTEESFQMELWPKKDILDKSKITGLGAGKVSGSRWFQENNIKDFKGIFIRHFSTNERLKKIENLGAENKQYKKLKVTVVMPKGVYTNVVNEARYKKMLLRRLKRTVL